jgi:hypothetical protein
MNTQETPNTLPVGLRAAPAVCRDRGISDTTLWRMSRRGWIKIVNICGKSYVDLTSLAAFDARAATGEFARKANGAALKAQEKAKEKANLA